MLTLYLLHTLTNCAPANTKTMSKPGLPSPALVRQRDPAPQPTSTYSAHTRARIFISIYMGALCMLIKKMKYTSMRLYGRRNTNNGGNFLETIAPIFVCLNVIFKLWQT